MKINGSPPEERAYRGDGKKRWIFDGNSRHSQSLNGRCLSLLLISLYKFSMILLCLLAVLVGASAEGRPAADSAPLSDPELVTRAGPVMS